MKPSPEQIEIIVKACGQQFRCFGGGDVSAFGNPIAMALKDAPLQFAAGVDVQQVVQFVFEVASLECAGKG